MKEATTRSFSVHLLQAVSRRGEKNFSTAGGSWGMPEYYTRRKSPIKEGFGGGNLAHPRPLFKRKQEIETRSPSHGTENRSVGFVNFQWGKGIERGKSTS